MKDIDPIKIERSTIRDTPRYRIDRVSLSTSKIKYTRYRLLNKKTYEFNYAEGRKEIEEICDKIFY